MRRIRLRKRLDDWTVVVVLVLVALAVVGGWVAYQTHVDPAVESEQRTDVIWEEQAALSHSAEVTRPNPVFDQGQSLSNRPVYFTRLAPELDGHYEYTYVARGGGALDVVLSAALRIRSVDDDGGVYWSVTEPLGITNETDVAPGESVTTTVGVNVSAVLAEIDRITSGLGSTLGSTEAELRFDTQVTGVVNDETVSNAHQSTLALDPDGSSYTVEASDDVTETHEAVEVVESERTYGPVRSLGPFVLVVLSLVGLAGLVWGVHSGRLTASAAERAALERYEERREFDDWISTGTIPAWERTGAAVELESLESLVDVAIDTNERVIEDAESGDFFVADGDRYYTYTVDAAGDPGGVLDSTDPSEPASDRSEGGNDDEESTPEQDTASEGRPRFSDESDSSGSTNGRQAGDR